MIETLTLAGFLIVLALACAGVVLALWSDD